MFKIENKADRAEVYLYGTIGEDFWGDGNSAKDFAQQIGDLSPKPLDIRIDSCGGDVYEAFAICSAVQRYEGDTTAYVDGLAASAASYIAVVCDKVIMNDYAWLMIHNACCYTCGNAKELALTIERLNQIDATIGDIIAKRSGMDADEVAECMDQETWFDATAALDKGLCQEIVETEERMAACLEKDFADRYRNVPAGILINEEPQPAAAAEGAEASQSHTPPIIQEKSVARTAIVLGNRVYHRKENNGIPE